MRLSSSTTMSAPTGIDSSRHYIMMSSELEGALALDDVTTTPSSRWEASVDDGAGEAGYHVQSLETAQDGTHIICLQINDEIRKYTTYLLTGEQLQLKIEGISFNSKVVKLESDRAYLHLSR